MYKDISFVDISFSLIGIDTILCSVINYAWFHFDFYMWYDYWMTD